MAGGPKTQEKKMRVEINSDVLRLALKTTLFAALRDFDPRRPAFSSILLDATPKKFRVVATDGYRLALFETGDGHNCLEPTTAILSAKHLADLKLPRASDVIISVNETEAAFQVGMETFHVPIVQARYPYFWNVFPPVQGSSVLHCEKKQFVDALMSARKMTSRKNRTVYFWVRPGCIAVAAVNTDTLSPCKIEAQSEISVDGVFDCDFLLDAVRALPAGNLQIRFIPPVEGRPISNPLELSPANQSGNAIRQLVMPCWRSSIPALPGVDS